MRTRCASILRDLNLSNKRFASNMSNNYIKRTTLFKVPKEDDIERVLKQYEVLRKTAVRVSYFLPCLLQSSADVEKDGKPYIISNVSRKVLNTDSPLSEGYTISSQSIFKNKDDHEFYDKECPAHKELKVIRGWLRHQEV